MSTDLSKLELTINELSEVELERLKQPSEIPCEYCEGPMNVGEAMVAGLCSECYWELLTQEDH